MTLPPEEIETRRPPMVDNEKIEHMYSASNPAIIAVLLAFLLLIIIITAVMVARYCILYYFVVVVHIFANTLKII